MIRSYTRADGMVFRSGDWLQLRPTPCCPGGAIGKFVGCYTNPLMGRLFRFTYYRELGTRMRPDSCFFRMDAIDDHDWSPVLESAWIVPPPGRRKSRIRRANVVLLPAGRQ